MTPALLANVIRNGVVESRHFGHLVVVDRAGTPVLSLGDPQTVTFIRSAAKPFQALPLFEDAVPEIYGLTDAEMAVTMASHSGEERHVAAVMSILHKSGCDPAALQCGIHVPLGTEVAERMAATGTPPTVLHNNCSGKHAGMLAACVNRGWPLEEYLDPTHPHQQSILKTISFWADLPVPKIPLGIDGCSAPNFALPLMNMARMYVALIASQEAVPARAVLTFVKHPEMIAGEGRFDTDIMRVTRGRIMAKTGAEGIECVAVDGPEQFGMALKIIDGASRAVPVIVLAALAKLGLLSDEELQQLADYRRVVLRNHRRLEVGHLEAAF